MHNADNISSLFDNSGNLTIEAIERYLSSSLDADELAAVEKHLANNPFDHEAVEGMRHLHPRNIVTETDEIKAKLLSGLRERRSPRIREKKAPNYWFAAAAVIILAGIAGLFLVMDHEPETGSQLAVTTPIEVQDSLPVTYQEDQPVGITENKVAEKDSEKVPLEIEPPAKLNTIINTVDEQKGPEKLSGKAIEEAVVIPENIVAEDDISFEIAAVVSAEEEFEDSTAIFVVVEQMPGFPGGEDSLYAYLARNIKYPPAAIESGIQGTVYVSFVVEKDGSVTDPKVLRGIGGGCDEVAIELIKNMPRWIPGKQRGTPIRVQFTLPVKFRLENSR